MLEILISSFSLNQPMMGFQTFLGNKGAVLKSWLEKMPVKTPILIQL